MAGGRPRKASDHPIPGEVWRNAPNGLFYVSDQGRAKTLHGNLMADIWARGQVRWSYGVLGRSYQCKASSTVAEVFLGGSPSDPVRHKNGDLRDLRACNLEIPWTAEMDDVIRSAENVARASAELGKSHFAVKRRAKVIGKTWERQWTYTYGVPLCERLEAVKRAISILERAGVSDRDINLALGIPKPVRRGIESGAVNVCLKALYPQMSPSEISEAFGWKSKGTARNRLRQLGLIEESCRPTGTMAGMPDALDGEEWRLHPCGVWISSLGRVASRRGLLKVQVRPNQAPYFMLQTGGRNTSVLVARLLLSAFRPDIPYSRKIFLNGDFQDVRLANIVGAVDAVDAAAQIRRLIPARWDPQDRREAEQIALLAMLEGRAATPADALRIAKAEHRELVGTYTHRSLDEIGEHGRSRLDRLAAD